MSVNRIAPLDLVPTYHRSRQRGCCTIAAHAARARFAARLPIATYGCTLALLAGACLLASAGCGASGQRTLSFNERVLNANQEKVPRLRARKLVAVARDQGAAGDVFGAKDTLAQAFQACIAVDDPSAQTLVLLQLTEAQSQLTFEVEARNSAERAASAAATVADAEAKALALARAGRAFAVARETAKARETLKQAESAAGTLPDADGRTIVLCAIAEAYKETGDDAQVGRILQSAHDLTASMPADAPQVKALAEIGLTEHRLQRAQAAAATFEAAAAHARQLTDARAATYALAELAKRVSDAGKAARSQALLTEAEQLTAKITASDAQRQALEHVRTLMNELPRG